MQRFFFGCYIITRCNSKQFPAFYEPYLFLPPEWKVTVSLTAFHNELSILTTLPTAGCSWKKWTEQGKIVVLGQENPSPIAPDGRPKAASRQVHPFIHPTLDLDMLLLHTKPSETIYQPSYMHLGRGDKLNNVCWTTTAYWWRVTTSKTKLLHFYRLTEEEMSLAWRMEAAQTSQGGCLRGPHAVERGATQRP